MGHRKWATRHFLCQYKKPPTIPWLPLSSIGGCEGEIPRTRQGSRGSSSVSPCSHLICVRGSSHRPLTPICRSKLKMSEHSSSELEKWHQSDQWRARKPPVPASSWFVLIQNNWPPNAFLFCPPNLKLEENEVIDNKAFTIGRGGAKAIWIKGHLLSSFWIHLFCTDKYSFTLERRRSSQ